MTQVHIRFSDHQVKEFIERYIHHEIDQIYIQQMLGMGKSRFFILLQRCREDPEGFSIAYTRHKKTRGIPPLIEGHILEELAVDK
ncbi:MAG TPA: hypothetical protein PK125_13725, partial [Syntrophorhabdus sp.]|nr:hypothetical protein [Syntrophorhabdus sp.]